MFRRAISLVTICAFLVSLSSCAMYKQVSRSPESLVRPGETLRIRAILTKSGERIEFKKGTTGQCIRDRIVTTGPARSVQVAEADVEKVVMGDFGVRQLLTRSGREYGGTNLTRTNGTVALLATTTAVPVSDVDMVWIEKIDAGMTFLVTIVGTALVIGAVFVVVLLTKESCPFVYSFDGSGYMLDAEPYGGATAPGLKRTEWSRLKYLNAADGEYRLKLTNEVDETQYTDELKLLVVDHPADVAVVADESGVLHSTAAQVPPTKAVDTRGRDMLSYVNDDDWVYWQSAERDLDPELESGVKEKLVFEFPRPSGVTRAKLIFDGCNTLWASRMVKGYLALHGRNLGDYYASLSAPGPAQFGLQLWNLREELYRMHIRVDTPTGWVSKGSVLGGGPFVSRDKLYMLDIAEVAGDVLRIELTPPIGFWMINRIAVDYSPDAPVRSREIEALRAVDSHGTDIRPLLAATDDRYVAMPATGDSAELVFLAPPRPAGLARSVILKASGYYDIHMGNLGDPQSDVLARIRTEPGYSVRYALEEYARWKLAQQPGRIQ